MIANSVNNVLHPFLAGVIMRQSFGRAELNLLAGNVKSLMESGQAYGIGARTINLMALRFAEFFGFVFVLAILYRLITKRQ